MPFNDDYNEPPVHFTVKDWLFIVIAVVFIYFELKYMYTWCKWFTNC